MHELLPAPFSSDIARGMPENGSRTQTFKKEATGLALSRVEGTQTKSHRYNKHILRRTQTSHNREDDFPETIPESSHTEYARHQKE